MNSEKIIYETPEVRVTELSNADIVTSSGGISKFAFVDGNGWDA